MINNQKLTFNFSFAVAQTRGEDVDIPVIPGLAAKKVQTVELEKKEEIQTDTSDKDTELEKRGKFYF